MNNRLVGLALKYYGTRDLSSLNPYQLDKIAGWATGIRPNTGQNQDRKAGKSKGRYIKGRV